jgi:hypothetical protein
VAPAEAAEAAVTPVDRVDPVVPAGRGRVAQVDLAVRAITPVDLADLADLAVRAITPVAQADLAVRAITQVDRVVPAGLVARADPVAHGTETPSAATSTAPPGATDPHRGVLASLHDPIGAGRSRRPEAGGMVVRSTIGATRKHPSGIKDSTRGASTSSECGSRCKEQLSEYDARSATWRGGRRHFYGLGAEALNSANDGGGRFSRPPPSTTSSSWCRR